MSEDLRSVKTKKALYAAMFSLLGKANFRKITVKGICEEAFVSRATFYAHFIDKYDLLKHCVVELWPKDLGDHGCYEQMEKVINCHVQQNCVMLKNLLYDADDETIDIIFDFILATLQTGAGKGNAEEVCSKKIVFANFYAGGMISYLLWLIRNKYPSDVPPMNRHLYEMLSGLQNWHLNKDSGRQFGE